MLGETTEEEQLCVPEWSDEEVYAEKDLSNVHHILALFFGITGVMLNSLCIKMFNLGKLEFEFVSRLYVLNVIMNIVALIVSMLSAMLKDSSFYRYLLFAMLQPIKQILMCWSIFVMISVAWEKYQYVLKPDTHYRDEQNIRHPERRFFSYTTPALLVSILLNLPKFWEWDFHRDRRSDTLTVLPSDLLRNKDYVFWYNGLFYTFLTGLQPLIIIIYLNFNI